MKLYCIIWWGRKYFTKAHSRSQAYGSISYRVRKGDKGHDCT